MTTPPPTVGVIGLGYGRAHAPAFQAAGCRVVAVCQRDLPSAKTIADRYGVPGVFERWEEMLDRPRPGIVVIATPPHLHHAIALRAFAQGAHVVCEKPVAMTAAEARAMVDAAARAGRLAMTGFNWRFTPAMQELHARVREGVLGRPLHLVLRWLGARWRRTARAAASATASRARGRDGTRASWPWPPTGRGSSPWRRGRRRRPGPARVTRWTSSARRRSRRSPASSSGRSSPARRRRPRSPTACAPRRCSTRGSPRSRAGAGWTSSNDRPPRRPRPPRPPGCRAHDRRGHGAPARPPQAHHCHLSGELELRRP